MSFHAIIAFTISILAAFIQVEFQSKSSSPFETHYWIMSAFFVVLFIYVLAWLKATIQVQTQTQDTIRNDNNHGVMTKISLLFGALNSILLLLILLRALGWFSLFIWTLYFVKASHKLVNDAIFELFDKLSKAIHGRTF